MPSHIALARGLVQDSALKHEDSRELRYQSDLVRKMETISVERTTILTKKTEDSCPLTLTTFTTKFLFLRHVH